VSVTISLKDFFFNFNIKHHQKSLFFFLAMEYEPTWRPNISDICRDFYKLSEKHSSTKPKIIKHPKVLEGHKEKSTSSVTIEILSVDDAIHEHRSQGGRKHVVWDSFKYHSITNIEAKYWVGYYYYHHVEDIPELQQISKKERIRIALDIFKETADKGNPSAQLRYGLCLWKGEGIDANSLEALKYLKMSASSENSTAMYIIGKAYCSGGNGIEQDKKQGEEYLKRAALNDHPKAIEMCSKHNIIF